MLTASHKTLLVAGAPIIDSQAYAHLFEMADVVIAVDAGAELCRVHGCVPNHLVGDLDSITSETLAWVTSAGSTVHRLLPEKDFSDLDAALDLCKRLHLEGPLTVTAATLGRQDHFLGVCGSLARHASSAPVIDEAHVLAWVLSPKGRTSLTLDSTGVPFSVIAVLGSAVVSIGGARYPLSQFEIEPLSTRGLSNVVSEESATISIHSGTAIVISQGTRTRPS